MGHWVPFLASALALAGSPVAGFAAQVVVPHHEIEVTLEPGQGLIRVRDQITLPKPPVDGTVDLALASSFEPVTGSGPLRRRKGAPPGIALFRLKLPEGLRTFTLDYQGAPALENTAGGTTLYLDGGDVWYPRLQSTLFSFSLTVDVPAGWQTVSQGRGQTLDSAPGRTRLRWREAHPQDDIYLLAGRYHVYRRETPVAEAQAYLLADDPALAERYLEATERYLSLYSRLLGPYPYAKFALVENRHQTGYGMPSFTLLGSRVIRLPFILHSSYPHEILHNWWGNGVYVDYASGNWSEGLTAYLADHLLKELQGQGAEYRRGALQKYADYVSHDQDFPLTAFRARHGEVSQAVGYNKALMFFHMLRRDLGDHVFLQGLRRFYRERQFSLASFDDLRQALETQSQRDLTGVFEQWVRRTGAPALEVRDVRRTAENGVNRVRGTLIQVQDEAAYTLDVPVAVTLEDRQQVQVFQVAMTARRQNFDLPVDGVPLRLDVDPEFDLFRRLAPRELPSSLGRMFAANHPLFIVPEAADPVLRQALRDLARNLGARDQDIASDAEIQETPRNREVWLLGWNNRFAGVFQDRLKGTAGGGAKVEVAGHPVDPARDALVLTTSRNDRTLAWLATAQASLLPSLGRRLPHYSRYSYLLFSGPEGTATAKGQWPVDASPLSVFLTKGGARAAMAKLPPRPVLTDAIRRGQAADF